MARIKAASFDDRLTLVEHLDELRSRLIFCGITLARGAGRSASGRTTLLLEIANGPLPERLRADHALAVRAVPDDADARPLQRDPDHDADPALPGSTRSSCRRSARTRSKTMLPLLLMVPVLFIAGVVFAYYVVVPAAVKFLLNFNDDQFNIQIRAREYYCFFSLSLISVGAALPDPGRRPRRDPARDRHARSARQEPPLRDPRHRRPRDAPARHRPDHDADLDAAADRAVRVQPDPRPLVFEPETGQPEAAVRTEWLATLRTSPSRPRFDRRTPEAAPMLFELGASGSASSR